MRMHVWAAMAAVGLSSPALALIAPPKQEPGKPPRWEFAFATGTTAEVVQKLNGERDRLRMAVQGLEGQERQLVGGVTGLVARVMEAARKVPAYVAKKAEMDAAEKVLQQARATGTSQEKLDASGRYNTHRLALADMEKRAVKADTTVPAQEAAITKVRGQLASMRQSLVKAEELRKDIVSRMNVSARFERPPRVGDEGTLLDAAVLDATGPDGVLVTADIHEQIGGEERTEVGVNVRVVRRKVLMQVKGIDAKRAARGDRWDADGRVLKIERILDLRSGEVVLVVSPSDGELQALLAQLNR